MNQNAVKVFPADTVIVREDTKGSEMYIILQGSAGVYKNYQEENEILLATLGAGNFFGEMSLFLGKERSATIVAFDNVSALYINSSSASEVFSSKPDIIYSMIGEFCKRIDNLNINYAKLKDQVDSGIIGGEQKAGREGGGAASGHVLFPERHGVYELALEPPDSEKLFTNAYTCPICDMTFSELDVRKEFRRFEAVLPSLRTKRLDIEPLLYQIKTCPTCYFSADFDTYSDVLVLGFDARKKEQIRKALLPYRKDMQIKTGTQRDIESVFAGYYLALICAKLCFENNYQSMSAELYDELSWIYEDCGDSDMSLISAEKALIDYKFALNDKTVEIGYRQKQRICYFIGDLYERLGEFNKAADYFDMSRKMPGAAIAINMRAGQRLTALDEYWSR